MLTYTYQAENADAWKAWPWGVQCWRGSMNEEALNFVASGSNSVHLTLPST